MWTDSPNQWIHKIMSKPQTETATSTSDRSIFDRIGTFASGACAVHCALCALAPGVLVALGLGSLIGHETEWGFTLAAVLFACAALVTVFRTHKSSLVISLLGLGTVGLLAARFLEEHAGHTVGMVIGLMPTIGIPLPLVSYGGSSLLATFTLIGVVAGVRARRFAR